ncbi:MAG: MliC family protein [Balneolaceae bacterium]|jgi:putative lipoprotein
MLKGYKRYLVLFSMLVIPFVIWKCTGKPESSTDLKIVAGQQQSFPDFSEVDTSDVYVYNCKDSLQFTVYVTRDNTWLFLPDTTVRLDPVRSGSGAKYQEGSYIYWSKGNEALLQIPNQSLRKCKLVPREKSWGAAKIRGVDFRALGQEPGWLLEIINGRHIEYVGNYGRDTVQVPATEPDLNRQDGTIIYDAQTEGHHLKVEIKKEPCTDAMSGFQFPNTVSVIVDGKAYQGCGKSLNR